MTETCRLDAIDLQPVVAWQCPSRHVGRAALANPFSMLLDESLPVIAGISRWCKLCVSVAATFR